MIGMLSTFMVAAALAAGPAPKAHIDVALGDVSLQKVPFLIAAERGLYAKNGLEVHQFITPGAAKAALENGVAVPPTYVSNEEEKAPVIISGGAYFVAAVAHGKLEPHHWVIIATNENKVRDHILARPDLASASDLVGKRLGSSFNDVTGYDGVVYLERAGLAGKVTIVDPASPGAVKDGRADAIMATLFVTAKAEALGLRDLVDVGELDIPEPGSGVMVDPDWLAAHRQEARAFLKAMVEATAVMKHDKAVFTATLAKWFNVTDPKMVDRLFAMAQGFPDKPYPAVAGLSEALRIYRTDVTAHLTPADFSDPSLVADLDRDGTLDRAAH